MKHETETERLVKSAYRGLFPSPAVEEAVQANLPAERARPRRLRPAPLLLSLAALVVLGFVLAGDRDGGDLAEGGATAPELPVVNRPARGVVPRSNDEVHVRIVRGGLLVVENKVWVHVSLDGLGEHLRRAADAHGKFEKTAAGVRVSSLQVVIGAVRETPWLHLQWVLFMCAEQRLPKTAFVVRSPDDRAFHLDAALPTDKGVGPPRQEIRVQVLVRVQDGRVRFGFGDREAEELASVARWLGQAKKAAAPTNVAIVGEVKAGGKTPFDPVAKLLAEFRQAGYGRVEFYGTQIPRADVRAAKRLPDPAADWPGKALVFQVAEGDVKDLDLAVELIGRRLKAANFERLSVRRVGNSLRVSMPQDAAAVAAVKALVLRKGVRLEFHITVQPDAPGYGDYRKLLEGGAREVQPDARYPLGARWYERADPKKATDPYVLCKNDDCNITGESLHDVFAAREDGLGPSWIVLFKVKANHQANMRRLTKHEENKYMAIIVDGKVHSAPILESTLSNAGQIRGNYSEQEARALAAVLASGPLPVRFQLAGDR